VELCLREEISLSKAAEIADMDMESFKDLLKARGLKIKAVISDRKKRLRKD